MKRTLGVQIVSIITALLFLSIIIPNTVHSIPPIIQETIIVDINGNGDYTNIQEAINEAQATDIIQIRSGTYNEREILIGKKIEIIGEDPNNTIINCSGQTAFTLTSSYIDISNLQIINTGESGIIVQFGSEGCTISNCIINTNFPGVALDLRSAYNKISDCIMIGFEQNKQGVKIHGSYNEIKNCDIQDFTNGVIAVGGSTYNEIINSNIINNENGIDFRLNSNKNIVTLCNIYSNLQSIKIWQNSNDNQIYLNNFWKNDVDAIDDNNNTWDNGEQGNYWDRYQGQDNNGDGIGDTPYVISAGNEDRYPFISFILPDIVTPPINLKHTSSKSDSTPSFSWNPSVYSMGIKGYYVKIDINPEIFIGDVTSWTSDETISDGVHTFYVRGESLDDKTSNYAIIAFSIDVTFLDADEDGWSDDDEQLYGTDPNDPNNYPLDTDNDHIPDSADTDDDNDGYSDDMESSYGTDPKDPNNYPLDTDEDGIPDEDSPDGRYTGDTDDDDDGLADTIEESIGSSSLVGSDVVRIFISGKTYYLVDGSGNGFFDILFEPISGSITGVEKRNEDYLIDANGDGTWDHTYSLSDGSVSTYEEQIVIPIAIWLLLIIGLIIAAAYFVPKYIKRIPIKYELFRKPERVIKRPSLEKAIRLPISEKRDTVTMITQTKTLLQNIQEDVEVYMEKLSEIEKQFMQEPADEKEIEEKQPTEEPKKSEGIHEIEARVDKLLSALDDKENN